MTGASADERGSATLLAVAMIGVLVLVGAALGVVGAMVHAHRVAQSAADLAALAGAEARGRGGDPCAGGGRDRGGQRRQSRQLRGRGVRRAAAGHRRRAALARASGRPRRRRPAPDPALSAVRASGRSFVLVLRRRPCGGRRRRRRASRRASRAASAPCGGPSDRFVPDLRIDSPHQIATAGADADEEDRHRADVLCRGTQRCPRPRR